jgi:hypothetical protein
MEDWGRWVAAAARWATTVLRFWAITGQVELMGPAREEGKNFDFLNEFLFNAELDRKSGKIFRTFRKI